MLKEATKKIISVFVVLMLMFNLFPPTITFADGETNNEQEDTQEAEEVTRNYEVKQEEEWDVSENGDGSVIAKWTLKDKTLRISGTGKMKDWSRTVDVDYAKYIRIVEKIIVEDGITKIGNYAFSKARSILTINNIRAIPNLNPICVQIPKSVTTIGDKAFSFTVGLTSIYVDNNNANYSSLDGVLYSKDYSEIIVYPSYKSDDSYTLHSNTTKIKEDAFSGCINLTQIHLSTNLKEIGEDAFYECGKLTNVEIPVNVTKIGNGAFAGCENLNMINIPEMVTNIEDSTFSGCIKLTNVEIPVNVTKIGKNAFRKCENLKIINIPKNVTSIGNSAFYGCNNLTQVSVDENNEKFTSIDNVVYSKDLKRLILYPSCKEGSTYKINNSTENIEDYAFSNCQNIKKIEISESVKSIGNRVFEECVNLTEINIPEGMTTIDSHLFYGCEGLKRVDIPNSVTTIKSNAFYGCKSLINLEIPNSVTNLEEKSFKDVLYIRCNTNSEAHKNAENNKIFYVLSDNEESNISAEYQLEEQEEWDISANGDGSVVARMTLEDQTLRIIGSGEIKKWTNLSAREYYRYIKLIKKAVVGEGIKNLVGYVFYDCENLETAELPDGLTTIGVMAFYSCNRLENINIPDSVTNIENSAFGWCKSLTSIEIPDGVKSINATFTYCSKLSYIKIPNGLTSMEGETFRGCHSLTNIEIPKDLINISAVAFLGCDGLTNIRVDENNSQYISIDGVLYTKDVKKLVRYPAKKENISYNIIEGVETIGCGAFQGCSNLTDIGIPNSVTSIESYAFNGCSNLPSIVIPNNVMKIKDHSFSACANLTNLVLPSNLNTIGYSAFSLCYKLNNIEIPSGVKIIPDEAFDGCINLKSVKIPKGVEKIYLTAFSNCVSLINLRIPDTEIVPINSSLGDYYKVICTMNSEMHKYAEKKKILYTLAISSDVYNIRDKKIIKIAPNTTIDDFLKNINTIYDSVTILNSNFEEILDNKIQVKTSNKMVVDDYYELDLVVTGDINGDGNVGIQDLLGVNKHRLGKQSLSGIYFEAGDVNQDGEVNIFDLLQINKVRLGKIIL